MSLCTVVKLLLLYIIIIIKGIYVAQVLSCMHSSLNVRLVVRIFFIIAVLC